MPALHHCPLWSAEPVWAVPQLHPAYQPVSDLAYEVSDLFVGAGFRFNIYGGMDLPVHQEIWREDTAHPTW